jgi:hypothetical protein
VKLKYAFLIMLATLLFSCDTSPGTSTNTDLPPTPLQVAVDIDRSIDPVDSTTAVEWYFDITYNGENVGDAATVYVNSTNVPAEKAFSWGYELTGAEGADFVPGKSYTISVTYDGTTYTETVQAPGDITVNADYTQVTWTYGGDFSVISANYTFGSGTYQMPGSLGPLTSPHSMPASAYPLSSGQSYDLHINIGTYRAGFGALHGVDSHVWIYDTTRRRFTK